MIVLPPLGVPLSPLGVEYLNSLITCQKSDVISIAPAPKFINFALTLTSLKDVKKMDKMGRALIERPKLFLIISYTSWALVTVALVYNFYLIFTKNNQVSFGIGIRAFALGYASLIKSIADQAKDLTNL